jgi:hypothetical protein
LFFKQSGKIFKAFFGIKADFLARREMEGDKKAFAN